MHSLPPSLLRPLSPEPVLVPSAALTAPVGPKPPPLCRESASLGSKPNKPRTQVEQAPMYTLRATDWHEQVLPYSSLAQELATRGSGPVVVLTAGKREADVAGPGDREPGQACCMGFVPGSYFGAHGANACSDRLVSQHVRCQLVECPEVDASSLKSVPKPQIVPKQTTCPMCVMASADLIADDLWRLASRVAFCRNGPGGPSRANSEV